MLPWSAMYGTVEKTWGPTPVCGWSWPIQWCFLELSLLNCKRNKWDWRAPVSFHSLLFGFSVQNRNCLEIVPAESKWTVLGSICHRAFVWKKAIFLTLFNNDLNYIPPPTAYPLGAKGVGGITTAFMPAVDSAKKCIPWIFFPNPNHRNAHSRSWIEDAML